MKLQWTLLVITVLTSAPAYPHHSAASDYLLTEMTEVEGVVTKFEMRNPHAHLFFDVKSPSGEVVSWLAEGNSAGVLLRRGWTSDQLKPGEHVKIAGRPARAGAPRILWTTITKDDGTKLYGGNTIPTFS